MHKINILPLDTIDGETLMSLPMEPPNFVVDSRLSQGLHILAGAPKVGKSWLALWLATTIAKGEPVWGLQTRQGTTLYLCLEDSRRRIQNRLFSITDEVPASVHFCTESSILEKGLEEQLTQFLEEHPNTVLIMCRPRGRQRASPLAVHRRSIGRGVLPLASLFRAEARTHFITEV